jgi:predicted nuclease of restriction endonuclease-like (RecB) superfamily
MQLDSSFLFEIKNLLQSARQKAVTLVNRAMIDAYWDIGCRIAVEEQKGAARAQYGTFLLRELARELTQELGKGLDERELRKMRQFYQLFPNRDALRPELCWTHYRLLLRVEDPAARSFYLTEAANQNWGTRELERNIQSAYYIRILSTRKPLLPGTPDRVPDGVTAGDLVKDPYIFEFLGLDAPAGFSESDLESAILAKLQSFLLEMGKGFAFVGRQYIVNTDTKRYYIDLVFYNFILKVWVLVELLCCAQHKRSCTKPSVVY